MSNLSDAEIVRDLTNASSMVEIVPNSVSILPIDHELVHHDSPPNVIKSVKELASMGSFMEYVERFGNSNSSAFVRDGSIKCFLDYHTPESPDWAMHIISFTPVFSRQWVTWLENENEVMDQLKFLNFIEDNILDVVKPDHTDLLFKIANMKIGKEGMIESKIVGRRESKSQSQSVEIKGDLIKKLQLGLLPYKYNDIAKYEMNARLTIRTDNENNILFKYSLIDTDKIMEQVWDEFITEARQSLMVYI